MRSTIFALAGSVSLAAAGGVASVTPHDRYSSSIGVLGCKIDTNRVAYWPSRVDCDKLCIKVTANGRTVHLLKVDQSQPGGGVAAAHDISYDAYNFLVTGQPATKNPIYGGGIDATWEDAPMGACQSLLHNTGNKLPLSAQNSMNWWTSCPKGSWARTNAQLFNINDSQCTVGADEKCELTDADLAAGLNQAKCPSGLGMKLTLSTASCLVKDVAIIPPNAGKLRCGGTETYV